MLDEPYARRLAEALDGAAMTVASAESKPYTRKPYAPFMTSTLQQEAGRKLRFTSERTMRLAQRLYENGYITYMRTDSTTLSESAINAARAQATELYGAEYVHPTPRQYTRKVKNAQEAHEAIRPAGDVFATPGQLAGQLASDEFRLYELIWQRTVASQMADVRGTTLTLRIAGIAGTGEECVFSASGRTITFAGFLKAYVESVDEEAGGQSDDAESRLPALEQGQAVTATRLDPDGHSTNPPARYTEASLIKALEEMGIGRPSTYASIIKTILDRGYVYKRGSALVPSWVAFAVIGLLEAHFGRLVDFDFTAAMEDDLDEIAGGRRAARQLAVELLLRRRPRRRGFGRTLGRAEEDGRRQPRGHRRARGQLDQAVRRLRGPRRRRAGRAGSGRTWSGWSQRPDDPDGDPSPSGRTCPTTSRPTS